LNNNPPEGEAELGRGYFPMKNDYGQPVWDAVDLTNTSVATDLIAISFELLSNLNLDETSHKEQIITIKGVFLEALVLLYGSQGKSTRFWEGN
jgi:hypothetical protein